MKPDGAAYYERTPQSGCKVEIVQNDWQEVIRQNEKIPFELEHGELIRCFIFPVGEKISFVIMAHHLAGDGKGIIYDTVKIEKIIFVPPNVSYSSNIIGISTFNGEMTITYHGTEDKKVQQKQFFDRGVKNLLSHNTGM